MKSYIGIIAILIASAIAYVFGNPVLSKYFLDLAITVALVVGAIRLYKHLTGARTPQQHKESK